MSRFPLMARLDLRGPVPEASTVCLAHVDRFCFDQRLEQSTIVLGTQSHQLPLVATFSRLSFNRQVEAVMSLEDDIRKLAAAGTTMPKNPLTLYVRKSDRSVFVDISSGAGSYEELLRVFATFESPYYASIYDKAGKLLFEHLTQNAMIEP